jgi:N-acetyltransferase
MIHPIRLDGHLVQLEKLSLRHIYALEKVAANPVIWQHLPIEGWKKDCFWTWVYDSLELQMNKKAFVFAVIDNKSGKAIGTTRFQDMDCQHNKTDIGWTWYDPSVWGNGFNDEAKNLMLTLAFEVWNVVRIGFKVDERNLRSQRALEKIGAQQEGYIRKHMIRPDGSNRNSFLYGLTNDDWFLSAKHTLQNHVVEALIKHQTDLIIPKEVELASVFL